MLGNMLAMKTNDARDVGLNNNISGKVFPTAVGMIDVEKSTQIKGSEENNSTITSSITSRSKQDSVVKNANQQSEQVEAKDDTDNTDVESKVSDRVESKNGDQEYFEETKSEEEEEEEEEEEVEYDEQFRLLATQEQELVENEMLKRGRLDQNAGLESAIWWRSRCERAELRASFSEARNETLVDRMIILQEQLVKESLARERASTELSSKQSLEEGLEKYYGKLESAIERMRSAGGKETGSLQNNAASNMTKLIQPDEAAIKPIQLNIAEVQRNSSLEEKLRETKNSLDEALIAHVCTKRELDDTVQQLEEKSERLRVAQEFLNNSRNEHQVAIERLMQQMKQASARRAALETERAEERKKLQEKNNERVSKLESQVQDLKLALKSAETDRDTALANSQHDANELKKVMAREEALHLEMATIKIDLATRRSDEDDLIVRLEQQAIEFAKAQQRKKEGTQSNANGLKNNNKNNNSSSTSDWSSWMTSLVASKPKQ